MSEPQKNNVPNTSSPSTNDAVLSGNPNAPAAGSIGAVMQNNVPDAAISVNNTPPNSANSGGNNLHNSVNAGTVQFSSAMTAKAEQPKDYFAEQNAERAEKKQKVTKTRNRLLIILGAVIGIAVGALVAWLVVWLTQDHADDLPAPTSMQNEAQAAYEASGNDAAAIKDFFNKQKAEATSDEEITELLVVEASTYSANGLWEDAASVAEEANGRIDSMTDEQLGRYSGTLFNVYSNLGDTTTAEYYYNLSIERGVTYDGEEVQG